MKGPGIVLGKSLERPQKGLGKSSEGPQKFLRNPNEVPVSPISSSFPELAPDPEHLDFFSQISYVFP